MINSAKIIEELVSVDAWHDLITAGGSNPLHLSVSFTDARFAGTDEHPIEFAVELKRANIAVVLTPKLKVHVDTVVNMHPTDVQFESRRMDEAAQSQSGGSMVNLGATLSVNPSIKSGVKQDRNFGQSASKSVQETQASNWPIRAVKRKIGSRYSWDCHPIYGGTLFGPALDQDHPVFNFFTLSNERLYEEQIRIEVSCKAEDIFIDDSKIEVKSWLRKRHGKLAESRLKLAREALRHRIAKENLVVGDLDSHYANVVIADIVADVRNSKS